MSSGLSGLLPGFATRFLVSYGFRLLNAFLTLTYFQPDEYFQTWEPAFAEVFGSGFLTWEWRVGLRTSIMPRLFALIMRAGEALSIDYLVLGKCTMAALAATADVYTGMVGQLLLKSPQLGTYAWVASLGSTFNWYCSTRPFSNTFEMALTIVACYYWLSSSRWSVLAVAHILAHISIALRPSAALFWLHMGLRSILARNTMRSRLQFVVFSLGIALAAQSAIVLLDLQFYSPLRRIPYIEFFRFNLIYGVSKLYGENGKLWYLTQALPFLLMGYIPFVVIGWSRTPSLVKQVLLLNGMALSLISHKEQRFLFFLLPFLHIAAALGIQSFVKHRGNRAVRSIGLMALIVNMVSALYLSRYHMRGVIELANSVRNDLTISEISFLTPCHATPWQAHFRRLDSEFSPNFLTCDPPWSLLLEDPYQDISTYTTPSDEFFRDPQSYLASHPELLKETVVVFEPLEQLLTSHGYMVKRRFFNGLFTDDPRKSGDVIIMTKICDGSM